MKDLITGQNNDRLKGIVIGVVVLMLIPVIAMLVSDDAKWGPVDFVLMAVLLLGVGLTCELVLRTVQKTWHRLVICAAILTALFLVWAELAVGIFNSPFAGS